MCNNHEVETALLDVRKGYRLLSLYQRRVLDLCDEIVCAFETTLNFYTWTPSQHQITPRRGTQPTARWSWDFLPLYDFCVMFLPEGVNNNTHNPGDWMLVIRISADSGYRRDGASEPDPRVFNDPAECESTVKLYIYRCSEALEANWYYKIFEENVFPPDNGERGFDHGVRTCGMKFQLSEMENADAVGQCVERFKTMLRQTFPDQNQW